MDAKSAILQGKTALGIEFGSTRIKSVLVDYDGNVLAIGIHDWENQLINDIWTYDLDDAKKGLQSCYASLCDDIKKRYGLTAPQTIGAIGISAMMHGYIPFSTHQLAPFQTWRNTNTSAAAEKLTDLLNFNIPLRWSSAHLYQRILDGEEHVKEITSVFTLAAYVHFLLTGEKVIGIGDASGMFPIDSNTLDYDAEMTDKFDKLISEAGYNLKIREVFPKVLTAGQNAGFLTDEGAKLLDPSGSLKPGIPFCPPEGDAGTGMTATNSVAPRTGNLSAGTSTFAMIVLEHGLKKLHREIDMVTTPSGFPCAMSHANNGTTDLNAWIEIFRQFCDLMGIKAETGELFGKLYTHALSGDADCGGLLPYGYYSGENVTFINEGRPVFARTPSSRFNLANFMRSNLYTSLCAVKLGMDILLKDEGVKLDVMTGHGGLFKTPLVMQKILAAAVNSPVTVMSTAGEGGAWGIALLAAYTADGKKFGRLEDYLNERVFKNLKGEAVYPDPEDVKGFEIFTGRYVKGLEIEKAAINSMDW